MEALPFILAGINAAGSLSSSSQAARVADANAETARQNAEQDRLFAAEDAVRQRREGARRIGEIRAKGGASGVDVGTGSILDVITDDALETELSALDIVARSETRARASDRQGDMFSLEAKNTRRSAVISALGSGLKGFSAGKSLGS